MEIEWFGPPPKFMKIFVISEVHSYSGTGYLNKDNIFICQNGKEELKFPYNEIAVWKFEEDI